MKKVYYLKGVDYSIPHYDDPQLIVWSWRWVETDILGRDVLCTQHTPAFLELITNNYFSN